MPVKKGWLLATYRRYSLGSDVWTLRVSCRIPLGRSKPGSTQSGMLFYRFFHYRQHRR
ncbi:hypothetical protein WG66_010310 [Moniliophthora roreri]|nr:hypothetical protein WG66_010310 [Moniliophthora roreri]